MEIPSSNSEEVLSILADKNLCDNNIVFLRNTDCTTAPELSDFLERN